MRRKYIYIIKIADYKSEESLQHNIPIATTSGDKLVYHHVLDRNGGSCSTVFKQHPTPYETCWWMELQYAVKFWFSDGSTMVFKGGRGHDEKVNEYGVKVIDFLEEFKACKQRYIPTPDAMNNADDIVF